jgi:hypothetical protein
MDQNGLSVSTLAMLNVGGVAKCIVGVTPIVHIVFPYGIHFLEVTASQIAVNTIITGAEHTIVKYSSPPCFRKRGFLFFCFNALMFLCPA